MIQGLPEAMQLQPAPARSRWLMAALILLPALLITAAALGFTDPTRHRYLGGSATGTTVLVGLLLLTIAAVIDWGIRRRHLRLDDDGLEVTTSFYRRKLAWDELQIDRARVIDLAERTEFKPALKTNGTALPGFHSGWFRLRNRDKALVALAGGTRVLLIPTTRDFCLLLQPRQPRVLLEKLQTMAAARSRG